MASPKMQSQEDVFSSAQILKVRLFLSQLSGIYHLVMMGSGHQSLSFADEAESKQLLRLESHEKHLNLLKAPKKMRFVIFGTCMEKLDYWDGYLDGTSNYAQRSHKTLSHLNLLTLVNIVKTYHP
jgi:hypothetical protein